MQYEHLIKKFGYLSREKLRAPQPKQLFILECPKKPISVLSPTDFKLRNIIFNILFT